MSVYPGLFNDVIKRRAPYGFVATFSDAELNPVDLTGWIADAEVWNKTRTTQYAVFSVNYLDRPNGKIEISLTGAETTSLPDTCYYDILLTDTSGVKEYYLEGRLDVEEGYTT